jgi:YbbR domain-containing protein
MLNKLTSLLNQLIVVLKIERRHMPVFFFILVLSSIFWVLTVLSKNYTTTVHYIGEFVDFPTDKLMIDQKNVDLHLQVIAPGFTLLAHRFRFNKKIPLSVSTFIPKRKGQHWNYFLLSEQSISQIQEVLPSNMQLLHMQPNRIDIMLDDKAERVIPIKLKSEQTYKDLFRPKEPIKLSPSTIVISGPKAVVEVFDVIYTKKLILDNIDSDKSGKIEIEPLNHSEINYSLKEVDWQLKVEQFTEGKMNLALSVKNVPKGYDLKLFPENVTISYLVSLDKFELVKPHMFTAVVNFDKDYKRQTVELTTSSDFVENIRITPSKVEYILIKK